MTRHNRLQNPIVDTGGIKALVLTGFGGLKNFVLPDIPKPTAREGALLIRLAATSVNSIDIKIREGALSVAPPLPAILGSDIAETAEEVGQVVSGFSGGIVRCKERLGRLLKCYEREAAWNLLSGKYPFLGSRQVILPYAMGGTVSHFVPGNG